ncbi:GNAT family N-acetyltransferase [Murimonas intestini]|uniref:GNAT family N-acetyltransferase n=1 Tax=Murimonas intestini TaxID=1337051 RepID=UPI0011DD53F7
MKRRFTQDDAEAMYLIQSDPEVNKFLPWFPVRSAEEAAEFLNINYLRKYDDAWGYYYAVCFKEDNIPVGYVNVSSDESHDLGYGLRKEFWHMGIMTEACKALAGYLKNTEMKYITATHDINNPASGEVMKKIGMTYKYSYEEMWQPKNYLVTFRMYQLNFDGNENRTYSKYWDKSDVHFI